MLGIAGIASLCCAGTTAIAGGAAVAGSTAAGATFVSGGIDRVGAILVTGLATALPLFAIGLVLQRRIQR